MHAVTRRGLSTPAGSFLFITRGFPTSRSLTSLKRVLFIVAAVLLFGAHSSLASTVTVTITGPSTTTVSPGSTFVITATASTNSRSGMYGVYFYDYNYNYITGDTNSPYSSGNITAPTTPGNYTYYVYAYDNSFNWNYASITITVAAVTPSTPSVTGGGTGCSGSVALTASGSTPSGGTYNWYNVSSGGTALATGSTYYPTSSGTYYASYTYSGVESSRSTGVAATISAGPTIATAPTSPSTGLYFSYPFSGNANDASGNSNNGTTHGSPSLVSDRYGNANSAYSFNGSSQYISTATGIAAPGPQNFSISVWFKTSSAGGLLVGYSASQTGTGSQYDRQIYMNNSGQLYFGLYVTATGTANTIHTSSSYADGNWHHVVATCSTSSGSSLYVDGALQTSSSSMTTPETYTSNGYWRVGYNNLSGWTSAPSDYYFNGSLDDIAVYNSSITATDVYALYGAGSIPTCVGNALTLQANTVSGATYYWTGPNGYTSSQQNPTVSATATASMAGTYTCTVTSSGGCSNSISVTAVVNSSTLPSASFTASSPVATGVASTITYTGTYSSTSTYTWDFNGGTIVSGSGVGPYTVKWTTAGSKTVTLTVTNSSGCYATSTQTVVVSSPSYGNYAFEDPVTLNTTSLGISSNLTNFPALLSIQDNNLIISGTCTDKVYYPNGPDYDFAFVDPTTGNEMYYQVVSYNQTTGTLLVWVQIPTLTHSANQNIEFFYGSSSPGTTHNTAFYENTWASDYKGVFHFDESSYTGSVTDATSNGHTGTTSSMTSSNLVTGKIGTAYSFNGSSSKISFGAINITGSFTLSAWIKLSAINIDQKVMTNQGAAGSSTGGYKLGVFSNNEPESESGTAINRGSSPTPPALATGSWHYVQTVFNGSSLSTYVDGSQYEIYTTTTAPSSTNPFYIGVGEGGNQYYFNGTIDEARVSNTAKSSDWIKAEYVNQDSPASFTSVGTTAVNSTNAAAVQGALTYTWTGASSTDLSAGGNWTNTTAGTSGTAPATDGTASLVIPAGLSNYPSLTADASFYGLTIASGASINLNGHTLSVGCNIYNSSGGQILYGSNNSSGITFNGSVSTQTYTGTGTSNTAELGNLTINNSSGGTVTISGGPVDIYNTLTITKGNLAVASGATLTLKSTSTQTASVAAIPSGYSITGNVTAERFVTGGSAYSNGKWVYRNYRLMSSPVNEGTDGSGYHPYSLNYLGASTIITDCTSTYASTPGNPSLYLYNEYYSPSNASYTAGNFSGVTNISNTSASGYINTTNATYSSAKMYVGDGFMIYFRGDKTHNITGSPSKTSYPYVAPEDVTFSATGNLNQGTYSVVSWTGSPGLMYTTSNAGNASVRGYNLVGNPYPSSIDWSKFSNSNSSAAIYGYHVNPTIYVLNPVTSNYDTYNANTGIATGSAGNIIPSGQGFFVQANGTSPTLTFTESAKSSAQVTGSSLLLGTPVAQTGYDSYMRLKLITDSLNNDDMVIGFSNMATPGFNSIQDSQFLPGSGTMQSISEIVSDTLQTSEKWLPLPKNTDSLAVRLNVNIKKTGQYTIQRTDLKSIPNVYRIWLMDRYKKDSLDMRANTTYIFDAELSDTASYGKNRFSLIIRQDPALWVHLLNFTASKAKGGSEVVWNTENEQNYTYFTVERSIDGGKTFSTLGNVSAAALGSYSFLDTAPPDGADTYRLKMEDFNGNITYSKAVTLMYGNPGTLAKNGITIYPNPASTSLNLQITPGFKSGTTSGMSYEVQITNMLGALVKKVTIKQQSWTSDVSSLIPGTYMLQVTNSADGSIVGQGTFIKL